MAEISTTTRFVTLDDIRAAAERIKPLARVTPLVDVSEAAHRPLFLKCENLQPAGAFKIRGAFNMVAQLSAAERKAGVITYSSGNHGQAMALAARTLGAPAVVVMPTTAPAVKVEGRQGLWRRGDLCRHDLSRSPHTRGSRSGGARPDDGAAVRS